MAELNHYKYIGLDFETTGLDITKDEPIQIGIVAIDENGNVTDKFQSLIKPDKKTDELKHIVGFITGLSISDLESAPTRDEVLPNILKFFDEDTIVIGHNIKFDLDFLEKYFPECKFAGSIDTYPLSQTFVHYAPSYALEVLVAHLQTKEPSFNDILQKMI
ncbi:MAG: 3'-5' exonuclease [bacterium]